MPLAYRKCIIKKLQQTLNIYRKQINLSTKGTTVKDEQRGKGICAAKQSSRIE
jgi:hypothetical protein